MNATVQIESLAQWSAPREVQTRQGRRLLRKAAPTPEFSAAWKAGKDALKAAGLSWSKDEKRVACDRRNVSFGLCNGIINLSSSRQTERFRSALLRDRCTPGRRHFRLGATVNKNQTARFIDKIRRGTSEECWEWTASKTSFGYGKLLVDGKLVGAHRLAFELWQGAIPAGLSVLHSCDNPSCVNPNHLFLGTQKDNIQDCIAKRRLCPGAGVRHARSSFTEKQILEIRELAQHISHRELARRMGVSSQCIDSIVRRRTWKHL